LRHIDFLWLLVFGVMCGEKKKEGVFALAPKQSELEVGATAYFYYRVPILLLYV
jgi:hypothetical protein